MEKVVIVGAGPGGLLLARYLLSRGDRYQVEIYERLGDPREVALSNSRTIPYTLNERGLIALRPIDGLEEAIKAAGVENSKIFLHKANGKTKLLPGTQSIFNVDRISIVKTLLSSLLAMAEGNRLKLHFNCKCIAVDLDRQSILIESVAPDGKGELKPLLVSYDRLVGADGARSSVRSQFLKTQSFDLEQTTFRSCYKTLFFPSKNEGTGAELQPKGIHFFRFGEKINCSAVPEANGCYIGVVFVPRSRQELLNFASVAQVKEFFRQYFPEIGILLSDAGAEAMMKRPVSTQLKVRCSRYHHGDRVLLIGDAAHTFYSATGQGCNSAFEDVLTFASVLDECEDKWEVALAKFSDRRLPDTHALWELDDRIFPFSKLLLAEFLLRERWAKIASTWFPGLVAPPIMELMRGNTLPYTEILKKYRRWVSRVKASNEKIVSRSQVKMRKVDK